MDEEQKKISLPEAIILMLYIVPLDIVGLILVFFGLDDFFILDILTFPVTQFYFRMKGVKSTYDLIAGICELIPYIGALPIKSIGVGITIWIANHPKVAGVAQVATGKFGTAAAAGKTVGAAGAVK
jgi:hypothetical protein